MVELRGLTTLPLLFKCSSEATLVDTLVNSVDDVTERRTTEGLDAARNGRNSSSWW